MPFAKTRKGGAMATKTVKVSDLSGEIIEDEEQLARLVVEGHPELTSAPPIQLEVRPDEIETQIPEQQDIVLLSYFAPGTGAPRRFTMPVAAFSKLTRQNMTEVLQSALEAQETSDTQETRGRRRRSTQAPTGDKIDYTSPEHAGEPHRGTVSAGEQEYVREHLAEVNGRLARDGFRQIDPSDPKMASRY